MTNSQYCKSQKVRHLPYQTCPQATRKPKSQKAVKLWNWGDGIRGWPTSDTEIGISGETPIRATCEIGRDADLTLVKLGETLIRAFVKLGETLIRAFVKLGETLIRAPKIEILSNFINFLSTFYQLFINFFINFLSTFLSTFYQLFINFLSTFYQLFYQLFINFLSTFINFYQLFYQLFINFLSTFINLFINLFYQLFINLEEMITFDILWDIVCIAARSYYVLGFTSCGRARVRPGTYKEEGLANQVSMHSQFDGLHAFQELRRERNKRYRDRAAHSLIDVSYFFLS